MRLKSIKLAGFKSFVDPTLINFPYNLSSVVGPNGCGKSNVIDAVRWVMGESSAKNLRGDSMTDVIFNGSNTRKPVGQCTVELIFDNADSTLKGEYAQYAEVSIRRKVTREGQSTYFLNNTKCRRRDVTDIFLGTGLGPRSYSIIEQGMISRLIESKPEELRVFVEEAAGISKYKDRRRDTENRIRRTQENMERLTDIRDELGRQLHHLERQSQAAEKYKEYKAEERIVKAQLQALRWRELDQQANVKNKVIRELEVSVEAEVAGQRSDDAEMEKQRLAHTDLQDNFNDVQSRFYALGSEIARRETSIQHHSDRHTQLSADLAEAQREFAEVSEHLETDELKLEELNEKLLQVSPDLELAEAEHEEISQRLETAEETMQQWQQRWDEFNTKAAEPRHQAEVEQSRIQHVEQATQRLTERGVKLQEEVASLTAGPIEEEIEVLREQLAELELAHEELEQQQEQLTEQLEQSRLGSRELDQNLDEQRTKLQAGLGRLASLEALQQAALGQKGGAVGDWLKSQNLDQAQRLAQQVRVEDGWGVAVETVLGDYLQALCVDGIDAVTAVLGELEGGTITLLDGHSYAATSADKGKAMSTVVSATNCDLSALIAGVYVADDLPAALALRAELSAHESVITADGIWLGPNWLRVAKDSDDSSGVLERHKEVELLKAQISELEDSIEMLQEKQQRGSEALANLEADQQRVSQDIRQLSARSSDTKSELSGREVRVEQVTMRRLRSESEYKELQEQVSIENERLAESRMVLQQALDAMADDVDARETLLAQRDELREGLERQREQARDQRDRSHQLALDSQAISAQIQSVQQGRERALSAQKRLQERLDSLRESQRGDGGDDILVELKLELETLLEKRLVIEGELTEARRKVEAVEHALRELEQKRSKQEQEVFSLRSTLEKNRMDWQALEVRRKTLEEQLEESKFDLETVLANLPEDAEEKQWEDNLRRLDSRVQRLGPINLAAIDEYKTQSERKTYLDSQHDDLVKALETLESAIRKIDRETRTRFKETFDKVNKGLQNLFPKVFGGGHAYLEMTGDDLLSTGVSIMARPPGKRNSTIHLLSGGEKALTAIALVFSIFQLNPAPFCMLDEVDAPLDDANVGRYARLVNEMSEKVQFIYISHNKIAMEMADQLLGVTMHEPGVSRIVSVDVEEAAALAAS